jgi:hypothetical protein
LSKLILDIQSMTPVIASHGTDYIAAKTLEGVDVVLQVPRALAKSIARGLSSLADEAQPQEGAVALFAPLVNQTALAGRLHEIALRGGLQPGDLDAIRLASSVLYQREAA